MFREPLRATAGLSFVILEAMAPIFRFKLANAVAGGEAGCTSTFIRSASKRKFVVC